MNDVNRQALEAGKVPRLYLRAMTTRTECGSWEITIPCASFQKTLKVARMDADESLCSRIVEIVSKEEDCWIRLFIPLSEDERVNLVEKYEVEALKDPSIFPIEWHNDTLAKMRMRGTIYVETTSN